VQSGLSYLLNKNTPRKANHNGYTEVEENSKAGAGWLGGWVDRCHVGCVLKIINRSPVWENFNKPGYYQLH